MEDKDESIISHIEAFRSMLLKCFKAFGIILIPMFFAAPYMLNIFLKFILKGTKISLNYFSPIEVFVIQIKTAMFMALVLSFPYILKQIYNFLLPALYDNEKKFITSTVFISSILFILGSIFCIFVILPWVINFAISFSSTNITPVLGITNVLNLSLWLTLAFALMFQLPVVVYYLIKADIITYESLSTKRPYVVVILLIIAAILTPPDVVSQILLFIPTYFLFEIGLLFSRRIKKQSDNHDKQEFLNETEFNDGK